MRRYLNIFIADYCSLNSYGLDRYNFMVDKPNKVSKTIYYKDKEITFKANLVPDYISLPEHKFATRADQYLLKVVDTMLHRVPSLDMSRTGVVVGSTLSSVNTYDSLIQSYHNKESIRTNTFYQLVPITSAALIANKYNITNLVYSVSTACSTSIDALIIAYEFIKAGIIDNCIVGATEEYSDHLAMMFYRLGLLGNKSSPLEQDSSSITIGEGACCFLLTKNPQYTRPEGKIISYKNSFSNGFSTINSTQLKNNLEFLRKIIHRNDTKTTKLLYDLHCTGTRLGDIAELNGLPNSTKYIVAWKRELGHCMSPCGLMELATSLQNIKYGYIHNSVNTFYEYPEVLSDITHVMKTSIGIAGNLSSIAVKVFK